MSVEKRNNITAVLSGVSIAIVIGVIAIWLAKTGNKNLSPSQKSQVTQLKASSESVDEFSRTMRLVWEDHVVWTRLFLVSAADNNPDLESVTERLLKNQTDIGDVFKPYYGLEAGTQLTQLLKTHITTASDLVMAMKNGDEEAQKTADVAWYKNASEIADFLSANNPNWKEDDMRSMMVEHLDLTKQEAIDILGKKYEESIADYDKINAQILLIADHLTAGIVRQFPDKFK